MKTRITSIILVLGFLYCAYPALAATYTVDGAGGGDFTTIQAAINAASYGDTINVAIGTYTENIPLKNGVKLIGEDPNNTIIDGNDAGSVVTSTSCDSNTVLAGFTLTGGNAGNGGGMANHSSSPTVTNCTFTDNTAMEFGGGMFNHSSSPTVANCTFSGNTVLLPMWGGGGMCNLQSAPTVANCTFSGNTVVLSGGRGGGMYNLIGSDPTVTNCTFIGNTAVTGGGMYTSSLLEMTNCTFIGNAAYAGGGMYNSGDIPLANLILWGNTPDQLDGGSSIYNSDIQGGVPAGMYDAGGNIDSDPLFVDADGPDNTPGTTDDNLRLSVGSPCVDAGNNYFVTEPNDLDGLARIIDGDCDGTTTVDMGAYEFDWLYVGDFAGGCDVNLADFAVMAQSWQQDNPAIDIVPYLAPDGIIDMAELRVVVSHWLAGIP